MLLIPYACFNYCMCYDQILSQTVDKQLFTIVQISIHDSGRLMYKIEEYINLYRPFFNSYFMHFSFCYCLLADCYLGQ